MGVLETLGKFGNWYHRINLGGGVFTPGTRNQEIVFNLYRKHLPDDLTGMTVLDLGANACGLSVEFAKRGAMVTAIEHGAEYAKQGAYVLERLGLSDKVQIQQMDLFDILDLGKFDIVAYVGLSYHVRHPQLALDMLGHVCTGRLLASTQVVAGDKLMMTNRARHNRKRARGELYGWEPTEEMFLDMIAHAGFRNVELVSSEPHEGESEGNKASNGSYFFAEAGKAVALPFLEKGNNFKPQQAYY